MKENFTEDNNFEMRNYKFNPTFTEKDKKPNPNKFINSDKLTTDNSRKITSDLPLNKKQKETTIPTITDSTIRYNNSPFPITLSLNRPTNKNNPQLEQKHEEEINILKKNYRDKVNMLEEEYNKQIAKMKENNLQLINNIKNIYDKKLYEIKNQYDIHLSKINKQNLELLNEIRNFRANSISLQEHAIKIEENNLKWDEKFKTLKKEYENKFKQIALKIDNELPLDKIFMEINSESTPDNLMKMIKIIELRNKIGYYSFILKLNENYCEDYEKFDEINKKNIHNLKKYAMERFDNILKTNNNNNENINKENILKKSEIVNYESNTRNDGPNNMNNFNNLSMSKSLSITQEKFSSDLESFNFNDDNIPNKEIQVLTPPEIIK